ncbi:MAG: WG repeat-containing protein [Cyclobacteriaceae bacterium]
MKYYKIIFCAFICHFFALSLLAFDSSYNVVEQSDKQGLTDKKGKIIIPVIHEELGWSTGGRQVVGSVIGYRSQGKWGLLNTRNHRVADPVYSHMEPFDEQLIIACRMMPVINRELYGLIDHQGKTVLEFKYHRLQKNGTKLIAALDKSNIISYGVISAKGEVSVPFQYSKIKAVSENAFAATNFEDRTGLFDKKGRQIIALELDSITEFNNQLSFAWQEGKRGLVDHSGKVLLPTDYKHIRITGGKKAEIITHSVWNILSPENQVQNTLKYDDIQPVGKNLYKVKIGENEALIDQNNNLLTEFRPFKIGAVKNDKAIFKFNGKFGVFDKSGEKLLEAIYDSLVFSANGYMARFNKQGDSGWFLLDPKGKTLNSQSYDKIIPLEEDGLLKVKKDKYWGLINESGRELIFCKYDSIESMIDGRMIVHFYGEQGILNRDGLWDLLPQKSEVDLLPHNKYVVRSKYGSYLAEFPDTKLFSTQSYLYPHGMVFLEKTREGKYGLFDNKGKRILESIYNEISPLQEDSIYYVKNGLRYSFVSKHGILLNQLDNRFLEIFPMTEKFIGVKIDGKYGFVDVNGNLRIANRYEAIGSYENGYAPIKILGKWGYVDKRETLVVQPKYDTVYGFVDDFCVVSQASRFGLIDKKGDLIIRPEFDLIERLPQGGYMSLQDGKKGLIGSDGRHILMPRFDELTDLNNGYIIVGRKGKYGLNSTSGLTIIPMLYDKIVYDEYNHRFLAMKNAEWENKEIRK